MRGMTGKASFFTGERGMGDGDLLTFFLMAIKAESIQLLRKKFRILRGMGLMTGVTGSLFKR
jgi:hypothetical protein